MRKKILSVALAIMALTAIGATAQETITDKVKAKTEQIKNGTIIRKTKRATLIERKVRKLKRNVLFSQNEAFHRCAFFVACRPAVFKKISTRLRRVL